MVEEDPTRTSIEIFAGKFEYLPTYKFSRRMGLEHTRWGDKWLHAKRLYLSVSAVWSDERVSTN